MNTDAVVRELEEKYPGKLIIKNPAEIICEIDPTSLHPEYDEAIAVIDNSIEHVHHQMVETYEVIKGTLVVTVDGKDTKLETGESITISPNQIHSAQGNETWIRCISKPGWTAEDHILT